jgi:predicted transcriptional regulator
MLYPNKINIREKQVEDSNLMTLTADIVAAHVSNNSVAVGEVGNLVQRVHEALASLARGTPEESQAAKVPVVSVRASVKPDYIVCMECGKKQKTLRRHLQTAHSMTPDQYRKDYGLRETYPMTSPNYSEQRRSMAKTVGLGRKTAEPEATASSEGAPRKQGDREPRAKKAQAT